MIRSNEKNKLLEYFNVNNYQELLEYIRENPEDKKVNEMKDLFKLYGVDLNSEVNTDE
jgi:erythromycin esterase-like protein